MAAFAALVGELPAVGFVFVLGGDFGAFGEIVEGSDDGDVGDDEGDVFARGDGVEGELEAAEAMGVFMMMREAVVGGIGW